MDLPIWLLVGLGTGIAVFFGGIVLNLMKGKDPWGRERQHPEV